MLPRMDQKNRNYPRRSNLITPDIHFRLNGGLLLPVYVAVWPFLFMLVEIDALSFYGEFYFILVDARLAFYAIMLGLIILKVTQGYPRKNNLRWYFSQSSQRAPLYGTPQLHSPWNVNWIRYHNFHNRSTRRL